MNQAKFTDFLYSLGGTNSDKDSGEPKNSKSFIDGGENGIVTMSILLKGDIDNFEKSIGGGYVNLENSDLIKLNLFGVLSRALSAMKLPFGSFDITYAYSPFEISGGAVKFPKLEMGGPVMQIKGAAAYNFVGDDIDASLSIRPFGGLTMPIVSQRDFDYKSAYQDCGGYNRRKDFGSQSRGEPKPHKAYFKATKQFLKI